MATDPKRENQNSGADTGTSAKGRVSSAVGSTTVSPGSLRYCSSRVTMHSTTKAQNAAASTLNSRRACVRCSAVAPRRMRRGNARSPTMGTRSPKNSTELIA